MRLLCFNYMGYNFMCDQHEVEEPQKITKEEEGLMEEEG